MILTVNYNKTSGVITLSSDIDEIPVEVNTNSIQDGSNQLVFEMNKYSLNLFSRNLALIAMREGSQLSPNEFNTNLFYSQWLQEKNINAESFYLENGAGLSRESYATTQFFLDVLDYIHKSKYFVKNQSYHIIMFLHSIYII